MALIYVVEDDEPIRRELVDILARAGFEVETCESFEHVSRDILAAAPDLVLLDLTLPVKDGQHICHEVRRESEVPIIVLTSRTTEIDEVMAMTLGADDFVSKPFDMNVLTAKVRALLRRTYDFGASVPLLEHKGAILNTGDGSLSVNGEKVSLSKNEYRILLCLMENKGKTVSREKLMERLWQTDQFIDENTLTVNVNRLRKKLDAAGLADFIETKFGVGYIVD
mgnify:CR=1 FL=1